LVLANISANEQKRDEVNRFSSELLPVARQLSWGFNSSGYDEVIWGDIITPLTK
jgi:hypothetical protein